MTALPPGYKPEFESLKGLVLEMSQVRSVDRLLDFVVQRLDSRPHVALARIWLRGPGDRCTDCALLESCPDHTECLHLVASAGKPEASPGEDWSRLDGRFCRIPMSADRKVGFIATTGEEVLVDDVETEGRWVADREWARRERIRGFAGQPIIHDGEVLGVLVVFLRIPPLEEGMSWLRMIADHAAASIVNARIFEENERLQARLERENEYLVEEVRAAQSFGSIVGRSAPLREVLHQVELVAPTDANVLVLGASGTGKELVAREIHRHSNRKDRPLVRVNCASIPRELYESEFFGHVQGAFTGALKDRAGRFEVADGGTLLLDEVGEIPLDLQSKLLRVLQEGRYERVGEETTRQVDVRIVSATNRDLAKEVEAGRFRQDLFYRLNVFPIELAPLKERMEDIPLLAAHFFELAAAKLNRETPILTQANVAVLARYDWPGNVRELQNVIERAVITANGRRVHIDLPTDRTAPVPGGGAKPDTVEGVLTEKEMRDFERNNLLAALRSSGGKVYGPGGAAELLGLPATTLASRIDKLGLRGD